MKLFIKNISLFLIGTILIASIFILPCFTILPYQTGDLGKMNGIPFGPYDTIFKTPDFLFTENISTYDSLQYVEILTIGDSFSQGYAFGYQNYLGNHLDKTISNIRIDGISSINAAATLIEKKLIPNCKVLIIESVERYLISNLNEETTIAENIKQQKIISGSLELEQTGHKEIRYGFFDLFKLTSYYKTKFFSAAKYKKLTLSIPLFTAGNYSHSLYIYYNKAHNDGDLLFADITEMQILKAKNKLAELQRLGASHNIQIIYLVAADKYDMYYDFIQDNPYPANPTLEYFSDADSTFFVNSKQVLIPYLRNGIKDIYRVNDTHWSPKAAKIVGEHLGRIIKDKQALN